MAAITTDTFARAPPFGRAAEALNAIRAQHGRARAAFWARSEDDITRIYAVALVLENAKHALNLLADLERARQSGNPRKVVKVSKRLDRLLERLGSEKRAPPADRFYT